MNSSLFLFTFLVDLLMVAEKIHAGVLHLFPIFILFASYFFSVPVLKIFVFCSVIKIFGSLLAGA